MLRDGNRSIASFALAPFVAILALGPALSGCGRIRLARECRGLAEVVNPAVLAIDGARRGHPTDARTHRMIAIKYEGTANALTALPLTDRRLRAEIADYQKLLREASQASLAYSEALAASDEKRVYAARTAAERTTKREPVVMARLTSLCGGR